MTETFNVFDEPRERPVEYPTRWMGRDICTIKEPHHAHNWTIDYEFYGEVEYACPGDLGYEHTTIPTKENISDD